MVPRPAPDSLHDATARRVIPDTSVLAAQAQAGDEAAFSVLFRAHWAELRAFVWRMVRDQAVAEDLVQDVFLRLCERGAVAPSGPVTRAYLYAAARNHTLNYLKSHRVAARWAVSDAPIEEVASAGTPADMLQTQELARAARAAVWALPERCRQVYVLRRDHELGPEEIAKALGVSVKTVDNHLARAMRALRVALAPFR